MLFRRTVVCVAAVNLLWLSAVSQARSLGMPAGLASVHLRVQYGRNPIGICQMNPQLTWTPPQEYTFIREADYQIEVARSTANLVQSRKLLWDSGQRKSLCNCLPYCGKYSQ